MILLDQAADDHHIRGCPENVVQRQPINKHFKGAVAK